jgi:hypothetical protein
MPRGSLRGPASVDRRGRMARDEPWWQTGQYSPWTAAQSFSGWSQRWSLWQAKLMVAGYWSKRRATET